MARWVRYEVGKRVRKPHIRKEDGKRFKWWITLRFFDDQNRILGSKKYHYTTNETVLDDILQEKHVSLNRCYIKNLSLCWEGVEGFCHVDLSDARSAFFDGGIDFMKAYMSDGGIDFTEAQFANGEVRFALANFGNGDVSFENTSFQNSCVNFYFSCFRNGTVNFDQALFIQSDLDFQDAQFYSSEITFRGTILLSSNIQFNDTQFDASIVYFVKMQLRRSNMSFSNAQINRALFESMTWKRLLDFTVEKVNSVRFHKCYFYDDVDFTETEIEVIEFEDCTNHELIRIKWKENNLEKAIEAIMDQRQTDQDDQWQYTNSAKHRRAAETALLLKENFRKMGRYDDEDEAYVCYRDHQVRSDYYGRKPGIWNWIKARFKYDFIRFWFGKISGYGTKPINAIMSMILVWFLSAIIYCSRANDLLKDIPTNYVCKISSLISENQLEFRVDWLIKFGYSLYYSAITFLTIGYGDVFPTTGWLRLASGLEGFLGLFLMSVFTVTFMRKVLR